MASNIFAGDIEFDNKKHILKNNNRDIFGDIQFESSDEPEWGSTSKTNEFNKIKTGINRFLGLEHDHDYLKLVAIQEGKSYDDILKEFNLAQMNDFQATVGEFFHQATLGLLNNSAEFELTGNTLQDIGFATAQTISGGLGMLAGFGALDKGLEVFGKTMKYVSAASKLDKVLSNVKLVKKFAQIDTKANMFYRMAKTGATFGMYNAIDSFMQNNERYNDYYIALDKSTPDALQGFFFGLGIPLLGSETYRAFSKFVQDSKLGKAIVAMGLKDAANVTKPLGAIALQGITSQAFQGTNSLTQIYDGLKDKSPMRVIGSIMNVMFSAAIGLGAYDYSKYPEMNKYENPQPRLPEINDIREVTQELSKIVEVYDESIKSGNNIKFAETLKNDLSDTTKPEDVKLIKQAIAEAQKRTVNISAINDDNVIVTTKANEKTYQEELKKPEEKGNDTIQVKQPEKTTTENIKNTISQPDISNVINAIKQDLNNYKGMKRVPTASGDTAVEPVAGDKPSFIRDKRSNPNGLLKKDALNLIKKFEKGELTDDEQRQFNEILRKYSENEATDFSDVVNNYIKQFNKPLEELEDKDKIDDMWFLGGANIEYAWNKTLEDIKNKTVPFEKPKTNILKRLMYWAINPYAMQYLKDPILKELGTELNKAEHRVELKTMKFREPVYNVADEFAGLYKIAKDKLKKDYKGFESAVNKAIVEGNRQGEDPNEIFIKNGKYIQYADLAKNIFSKHRKFYYESRKRLNKFMEETLDHLKDVLGKDVIEKLKKYTYAEIEERPYFMPQQRDVGNVHIVVRDLDGKVIERYHEFDPVALLLGRSYKAKKIIEQMKKKYGADNIVYEVKEPEPLDITKIDALNLLDIINNVVDNTDITKEQRRKIIDNIVKEVKSKGFMTHTIHRSKREIGGYIEDPLRAMQLYLSQATAFVSKQSMKWELNEIEQNLSHKWNSDVRKMFNWHKEQLLGNKTTLDKTVNYVRSFLFLRYLGLNFKNAFVNVIFQQPITAMHLTAELGGKNLFDPAKASGILTKAGKDVLTGNLTDREKAVMDTLDKLGITKDQKNQFMLGRSALLTKTWNQTMETAGLFMKYTEILNRKTAALAYLRVHPELMGDEAVAKARDFVYTTNGKYGDSELAVMFQGKGALKSLGKVGQTFQTYNHQVLLGFLKLHNEKQYGAILFGVGALMFMGGLRLMPFYDTIKSEYTKLTGRDLEVDLHKKLDNGEINFLLNGGLMGNLPLGLATDISSSAGFQMPTDELSYSGKGIGDILMSQFFGVAYSTAKDFGKSLDYLSNGDLSKAIYYSPLPRVMTYPFKALQEYKWGLTTSGDLIIDDPVTGRPMKVTQQEALLQSIGFTPERISEFKNLYYTYKTLSQYYSQKRKQLYSEYKVALNDGNKDKLIKVVKQMENLNKQIMDINSDYGMGISYANIHNLRSVYSNKSMRNFLYNNLGGK